MEELQTKLTRQDKQQIIIKLRSMVGRLNAVLTVDDLRNNMGTWARTVRLLSYECHAVLRWRYERLF